MNQFKKILVLGPHADDVEFGCGGTMARFIEEGKSLACAVFSVAEGSVREGEPKDIHELELKESAKEYNLADSNLAVFHFPVREFPRYRQEILEKMVELNHRWNPDLVYLPSNFDTHQDHQVIAQEGFRAFKQSSILGYELPWNNLTFSTEAFVSLQARHVDKKITALSCYRSQTNRPYMSTEFIKSLAKTRGIQISSEYAESFEVIRWITR